jgi:hypothetical protein
MKVTVKIVYELSQGVEIDDHPDGSEALEMAIQIAADSISEPLWAALAASPLPDEVEFAWQETYAENEEGGVITGWAS